MRELTLQQRYRVKVETELTLPDVRALTQVYLPIIGHEAFTLYMALACYPNEPNREYIHTDLLDQIGLSHHAFLDARQRLEGMGLMKTFQQDLTEKTQWVYELIEPMTTQAFLADSTLASLLAHYLGETTLNKLVADTVPENLEIPGENVTASFFDLVGAERFKKIKAPVQRQEQSTVQTSIKADQQKLDLNLMHQMLQSFNVPMRTLKENEAALLIEKELYGLDDVTLVRLIQQNLTPNHEIDMTSLRKSLQRQTQANQRQIEATPAKNTTDSVSETKAATPANNRQATDAFLQQVKTLPPVTYLQALREANGGFITDSELKSLEDIAQLKRLPNEVINVMLYELTVVEKRTSLSRNLLQTIVNDWTQAGIKTAPAALKYLQKRQQQKQQTSTKTSQRYNKRPVKNETRPDWENQRVKAAASSTEQAEAQRKLAALLNTQNNNNTPKEDPSS